MKNQHVQVIEKLLVANRGEIALRVMRTCRQMGIATVAVFSDADGDAAFVDYADEAVRIGPAPATDSYLRIDRIVEAARATGAQAIHPGYGFLAENPQFAVACAKAGLTFVGPSAEVIRVLGSKRESKRLVGEAGVPIISGYAGDDQSNATLAAQARAIGFPVLLKASAGGGGKGMRIVRAGDGLDEAIDSAKREARSAFGDDTLLIEKYIDNPRHIEIQILGDAHGNLIHLFERECSIQRRHQKIIEESPSPIVSGELREKMGAAAIQVGRAVGYQNAGTVEFIVAPDGQFYFLEVNTRLQVEHPVTECVTGIDLVREQIRVAMGETLAVGQSDLAINGAAIECRLYAEDPANGFLPTSGAIVDWRTPVEEGLRIDSAVTGPTEVGIHYDPMLAKVICHAPTRAEAIFHLADALRRISVHGIVTNRDFLIGVLKHPRFVGGEFDTHFLDRHLDEVNAKGPTREALEEAAIAGTLAGWHRRRQERALLPALAPGFRNNRSEDEWIEYRTGGERIRMTYRYLGGDRFVIDAGDGPKQFRATRWDGEGLNIEADSGLRRRYRCVRAGDVDYVQGPFCAVALVEEPRFPAAAAAAIAGGCVAPMPGTVVKLLVSAGQSVGAGDTLIILEAMKMEHSVRAVEAGVVERVLVGEGDQVFADQLLVVVCASEDAGT
jgi:acetyl-CoA carboxylase biotin carboxylase subunit